MCPWRPFCGAGSALRTCWREVFHQGKLEKDCTGREMAAMREDQSNLASYVVCDVQAGEAVLGKGLDDVFHEQGHAGVFPHKAQDGLNPREVIADRWFEASVPAGGEAEVM